MKKIAVASLMLMSTSIFAHNLPVHSKWESDYVIGKSTHTLHVTSQSDAAVTVDPNSCFFNHLGIVAGCTLMGTATYSGKLDVKNVPANRMTLVYGLENSQFEVVHNLSDEASGFLRLLKVDNKGNVVDSVRLFKK
ncbi:hypothetical protein [Silvanigrella aquatica]|uniref:DUF306 domain-containing protein n=1 Tax=Silvanigrella aquatica TaxID=1915309 RepID=A0A1L4CYD5_9BACT|nr:hypothetical protein [Silvanigrella aquatica]APJ02962.1 hypothetical protein AXG55_03140 [Silvanigrella aquatica]